MFVPDELQYCTYFDLVRVLCYTFGDECVGWSSKYD